METLENPENPLLHAAAPTVVWDSGRVDSEQSRHVPYAGVPLQPMARYRWRVRIWSAAPERAAETSSRSTGWSEPASFETGPFSHEDWGGARWIGGAENETAPLLRTGFVIDDRRAGGTSDPPRSVVRARLYFSGLGYGEPYLDGVRVGERVLDPAPTDYDRTVLFSTYDVTSLLQVPGDHVLAAMLGGGRYDEPVPNVWLWERAPWRDRPKLLAQLVIWYADGTVQRVVTGPSWRASGGPIRSHSLYTGELYDARQEQPGWNGVGFDDTTWAPARLMTPPRGTLRSQQLPPIMPRRVVNPIGMSSPEPGVVVYDLGEQIAGWARLRINGPAGTSVQIRYGERLLSNGRVDIAQPHIQGEIQTDTYILRGGGDETYEPHFSYKGFQYVEVSGYPGEPSLEALTGVVLHSAVRSTAEFDTDAEDVNRLHHGVRTALLNNLHGVPTDTPVFEKNGWTGDAHLTAEMAAYNFDLGAFWTKWLQDWVDAQLPSGEFPPIVPTPGWGYRGSEAAIIAPIPAWDVAYFEIPWTMYRYYGDERVLARHY
ncbi:MAG TPA: family 78 glycoside hydrolase catalytic domain, partial [Actinopolymorphaceae bacterium]